MGALVGDLAAVEEIFALKDLMTRLSVTNLDCRQDGAVLDPQWGRATYRFNATIAGIDLADALLIVGSNPRREAAVLNARIRKRWRTAKSFPSGSSAGKRRAHLQLRLSRRRAGDARHHHPAQLSATSCAMPSARSSSSARKSLRGPTGGTSRRSRLRRRSISAP